MAKTPEGAVALLVGLSKDYGDDAAAYGEGLLVLREDFRDPVLRARGAAWGKALTAAIARCFGSASAPETIARLMLSQWQGSLTWWGFGAEGRVDEYVETELRRFLAAVPVHSAKRP